MRRVRKGEVAGMLVWRLDRLARNMVDGGAVIYELSEGRLKEIVTPEAAYTGTADAKFMLSMLFGAAAKYTDDLSAAIRRGNKTVLERGMTPGPVPLGYLKTHEHEQVPGTGIVVPDPERFETVKRIWRAVLDGTVNVSDVWRKARYDWGLTMRPTKHGLARPIGLTNLDAVLRNPFYAGKVVRSGETYDLEHPPMVTWAEFQRVQGAIGQRHATAQVHLAFLYQGLLTSGSCQRAFTGSRLEKGGHVYVYYRCGRRRNGFYKCDEPEVRGDELLRKAAIEQPCGVFLERAYRRHTKLNDICSRRSNDAAGSTGGGAPDVRFP